MNATTTPASLTDLYPTVAEVLTAVVGEIEDVPSHQRGYVLVFLEELEVHVVADNGDQIVYLDLDHDHPADAFAELADEFGWCLVAGETWSPCGGESGTEPTEWECRAVYRDR